MNVNTAFAPEHIGDVAATVAERIGEIITVKFTTVPTQPLPVVSITESALTYVPAGVVPQFTLVLFVVLTEVNEAVPETAALKVQA